MSSVWRHSSRWFVLGLLLGGVLVAAALTAGGALVGVALPEGARLWVLLALLAALALAEVAGRADRLPQNRRLVPQTILAAEGAAGPLQFGFEMGTGLRTYSTTVLPMAVAVMAVLWAPNAAEGLALGVGFGLGRSLVIPARRGDPDRWDHRAFGAKRPAALILAVAFGLVVAGLLLR